MKKIFTIVILLSMGITQIYAQCLQCPGTTASTSTATSIGFKTNAGGLASFAGGNTSEASGDYSFAFGNNAKALNDYGIAFGSNAQVFESYGIAIGNNLTSKATNSLVFGMGSSDSPLVNSKSNSIMFGVTDKPSLTILAKVTGNSTPTPITVGYIGIGTDEPEEMAHVVGKLLIERTETTASSLQFKHPETSASPSLFPYYWDIYSDIYGLRFNTMINNSISTQRMIINSSGFVGIGVSTPQAKLHVDNNILAEGNITTLDKFVLAPAYNSSLKCWEISRTNAGLNFTYTDRALQNVLFLGNDGSIGVGKTNPSAMLDVNGSIKATGTTIDGNAIFNGNVGIGTANPKAPLHIHNSQALMPDKNLDDRGSRTMLSMTTVDAMVGFTISYNNGNLNFRNNENGTFSISGTNGGLSIAPNGNIGIGKDPQAKLDVNGALAANSATINGALTANSAAINGAANVTGALTANSATINGAANVTGALTVNSATINGAANVTGALTANSAKITGDITVTNANINGKVKTTEVEVTLQGYPWPDYVFENNYPLMNLQETEQFIKENKHLPNVPSAAEVEANGVNLGEMNAILIQKVEEMTLHIIQLEKRLSELESKKGGE